MQIANKNKNLISKHPIKAFKAHVELKLQCHVNPMYANLPISKHSLYKVKCKTLLKFTSTQIQIYSISPKNYKI